MASYEQGSISSAPQYRNLLNRLRDFVSNDHVDTAVINASGTLYVVGDLLTVAGGVVATLAATIEVLTVGGGGEILTSKLRQSGAYSSNPATPNSVTGGTGSAATFDLTFTGVLWTINRDDQTADHDATEIELQLEGIGDAADEIFIGIRSFNVSTARNWELAGFTGFASGNSWGDQPGKSPGPSATPLATDRSAYMLLTDSTTLDYWFNVTGRRIICVVSTGTGYSSMYLGWMNQFATITEYPYPLLIMGCSNDADQVPGSTIISYSGIADPVQDGTAQEGPGFFRFTDGQWYSVYNSEDGGGTRSAATLRNVLPAGRHIEPTGGDLWYNNFKNFWRNVIPDQGNPGVPSIAWIPINDSGGDIFPLLPATVVMTTPSIQLVGEMDDTYWVPAFGTITSKNLVNVDFTAFQSGNRTEDWAFFAIRTSE